MMSVCPVEGREERACIEHWGTSGAGAAYAVRPLPERSIFSAHDVVKVAPRDRSLTRELGSVPVPGADNAEAWLRPQRNRCE